METIVISLGGSVLVPNTIDSDFLARFTDLILEYTSKGNRAIIIVGGGKTCRDYQDAARKVGVDLDESLDWVGIMTTRLNAQLLISAFKNSAYSKIVLDPLNQVETDKQIIVSGGFEPGNSSDLTAVQLAKTHEATEVINISNIDHVYSEDPKNNPDAKIFDNLTWKEFLEIIGDERKPGGNWPFDPIASKFAQESGITAKVIGPDIENLKNTIEKKEFTGTIIQ